MNTRIVALFVLATATMGCSRQASSPMQPVNKVIGSVPADGATGVRLDAAVTLDFGAVVDQAEVERGVHLLAERDMFSLCPDPAMPSHGTMESVMDDPSMLQHMDAAHATAGQFSWNAAGTACAFQPDSLMGPQTRYMVHMSGTMLQMMRQTGVSMMDGRMNTSGDMMLHFQTMTADDHGGHH